MNQQKRNLTLNCIGVSPVNIHGVAQHSHASNAKGKLKKVLNVHKENISAAYNVSDNIEFYYWAKKFWNQISFLNL